MNEKYLNIESLIIDLTFDIGGIGNYLSIDMKEVFLVCLQK
jgi:hypothetical protein